VLDIKKYRHRQRVRERRDREFKLSTVKNNMNVLLYIPNRGINRMTLCVALVKANGWATLMRFLNDISL
jgi:hypothetical protein